MEGLNQNSQIERTGIIIYDGHGHMSVQIFNTNRPKFANGRPAATDKEKADAFNTYTACRLARKDTTAHVTWEKLAKSTSNSQ